jgi:Golgi complex component 7 (COG7)
MKVQLAAEDIEQQLFESSSMIVQRVTAASHDLARLRSDLLAISGSVDTLAAQVVEDERKCSVAAAPLTQLDSVKRRVQDAKSTLQVRACAGVPSLLCIRLQCRANRMHANRHSIRRLRAL